MLSFIFKVIQEYFKVIHEYWEDFKSIPVFPRVLACSVFAAMGTLLFLSILSHSSSDSNQHADHQSTQAIVPVDDDTVPNENLRGPLYGNMKKGAESDYKGLVLIRTENGVVIDVYKLPPNSINTFKPLIFLAADNTTVTMPSNAQIQHILFYGNTGQAAMDKYKEYHLAQTVQTPQK